MVVVCSFIVRLVTFVPFVCDSGQIESLPLQSPSPQEGLRVSDLNNPGAGRAFLSYRTTCFSGECREIPLGQDLPPLRFILKNSLANIVTTCAYLRRRVDSASRPRDFAQFSSVPPIAASRTVPTIDPRIGANVPQRNSTDRASRCHLPEFVRRCVRAAVVKAILLVVFLLVCDEMLCVIDATSLSSSLVDKGKTLERPARLETWTI